MKRSHTNLLPGAVYLAPMFSRLRSHARYAAVLTAVFAACSPAPMPISSSSRDPSSPFAPEGVTPAVPASAVAHDHHPEHVQEGGDAGAQVYVCPMHPEVAATASGLCPKCNMKLVPKK